MNLTFINSYFTLAATHQNQERECIIKSFNMPSYVHVLALYLYLYWFSLQIKTFSHLKTFEIKQSRTKFMAQILKFFFIFFNENFFRKSAEF